MDPLVSIMDSLNTSCGKVSDEMSFSKSSDFRDKSVSSVFMKRKICFSDPCLATKIPMKTKKATIQLILNSVFYCNLYLLHLISEKIWLHHRTVSVAQEQRNLQ
jgi:hypothetical protein